MSPQDSHERERENYIETNLYIDNSLSSPPSETKANVTIGVTLALQHDIHGPCDPENIPHEYCQRCVDEALGRYKGIQQQVVEVRPRGYSGRLEIS